MNLVSPFVASDQFRFRRFDEFVQFRFVICECELELLHDSEFLNHLPRRDVGERRLFLSP